MGRCIISENPLERVIVLIPTYNEIENLVELHRRLRATWPDFVKVFILDDNSPDGTGKLAEELASRDKNLRVIHLENRKGLGAALVQGYKIALKNGGEFICTMDADLSHAPEVLPEIVDCCQKSKSDLVVGTRWIKAGGMIDIQVSRIFISKIGNTLSRHLLGLAYRDCNSNFRCYRRESLSSLAPVMESFSLRYGFLPEVIFHLHYSGWKISEYPIIFVNRQLGQTKIGFSEMFHSLLNIGRLSCRRLLGRPSKVPQKVHST
jgi:dolichol-phosphate mannosyltransferase